MSSDLRTTKGILSSAFTDAKDEEIVMVTLDAQEIAGMTMRKLQPHEFHQELFARFKVKGAPVEGIEGFYRIRRGHVMRMKSHPLGPGYFGYLWFSDEAYRRLYEYRDTQGFDTETGDAKLKVN